MAVTSPGKSMVAGASKGRGIGRGNFYLSLELVLFKHHRFGEWQALAEYTGGPEVMHGIAFTVLDVF